MNIQLGQMLSELAQANLLDEEFYLIDSQPIPMCNPILDWRVLLLRDEGAHFGKGSKGWFFGFKLHLLVSAKGLIVCAVLTPANWDDRDVAAALCQAVAEGSFCLGDRGYRRPALQEELFEDVAVLLFTRSDAGQSHQALLCSVRQRVETVFSQLWERLPLEFILVRGWGCGTLCC